MPGFNDPTSIPEDADAVSWQAATNALVSFVARHAKSKISCYASLTDAHDFKTFLLRLPGQTSRRLNFDKIVIRYPNLDLLKRLESPDIGLVLGGEYGLRQALVSNCAELERSIERLKIVENVGDTWEIKPWARIPSFHCWLLVVNEPNTNKLSEGVATFGPWSFDITTGLLTGAGHYLVENNQLSANHDATIYKLLHWFEGNDPVARIT